MQASAHSREISGRNFAVNLYIDPFNKRIRVDDLRGNVKEAMKKAEETVREWQAEKLIVKTRMEQSLPFIEAGYQWEGKIDHYFLGSDCYFFCKYFTIDRRKSETILQEDDILQKVHLLDKKEKQYPEFSEGYKMRMAYKNDAEKLAALYKKVFKVYPTPLTEPDYIRKTMEEGTIYGVCCLDNRFVSAASAEINRFYKNAEITDCATLKEHRKHGLMKWLILALEKELKTQGIFCAYSLSRALSFGMNGALYQLDYRYRGRLVNNCLIYSDLENMNIWVKNLSSEPGV